MAPAGFTPKLTSCRLAYKAGVLPFSDVFNLTNLRSALKSPVVEWSDVKTLSPLTDPRQKVSHPSNEDAKPEPLGCWSVRQPRLNIPIRVLELETVLNVDMSFTRVPPMAFFTNNPNDTYTKFSALAALIQPNYPHPDSLHQPLMEESRLLGLKLPPEDHLACFDFLYWVTSGFARYEMEMRWSPAWNTVGTHLTFTESLKDITRGYLRRAMELPEDSTVPPVSHLDIQSWSSAKYLVFPMTDVRRFSFIP